MQSFKLVQPDSAREAAAAAQAPGGKFIAGGSDLLQLMKDNVETPSELIDLEPLPLTEIQADANGVRLGAMARMSDVAADPDVRKRWPAISQALLASASAQVRNMGTIGGNLLQRTRCGYFRDTGFACNKRSPGSGCPAINGENRMLAILGVSDYCIASHPSDLAVALVALDATVEIMRPDGVTRTIPIGDLHRTPGNAPDRDTTLEPGELITAVMVPASESARNSYYLKVRDRASFEFSLVSAAVALQVADGAVRHAAVAGGGVGTKPWRLPEVEAALEGKPVSEQTLRDAAMTAGQGAQPQSQNGFKVTLLRRTVFRALQTVVA